MFRISFSILIILHLLLGINCWDTSTILARNFNFTKEDGIVDAASHIVSNNRTVLHLIKCPANETATVCHVTQEVYSLNSSSNDSLSNKTCSFKFFNSGNVDFFPLGLKQINEYKFVYDIVYFLDYEKQSLLGKVEKERLKFLARKLEIMNMENCELIREDIIVDKLSSAQILDVTWLNLVPRPDNSGRFDVFFADPMSCKDKARARISYDVQGKLLDGPTCFFEKKDKSESCPQVINQKAFAFTNETFLVLDNDRWHFKGYLVNYATNEGKKIFEEENEATNSPNCSPDVRVSINQDQITYCWLPFKSAPETVFCSILNVTTNEKKSFSLSYDYKVLEFEIFSLANGDVLTLTGNEDVRRKEEAEELFDDDEDDEDDYVNLDKESRSQKRKHIHGFKTAKVYFERRTAKAKFEMRRYNNSGKLVSKPEHIEGISCRGEIRDNVSIVKTSSNKLCINFLCKSGKEIGSRKNKNWKINFAFDTKCLDLKDFEYDL